MRPRHAEHVEQAQRFLDHAPRPKRRKAATPNPGAQLPPRAVLHVTEDRERHAALIRGRNVPEVLEAAGVLEQARWSVSAKGYVVPSSILADVCAVADYMNAPYRVTVMGVTDAEPA